MYALFTFTACDPDSVSPEPVIESPKIALHYDAANQDAPSLTGARTYEGAIRIPQSELGDALNGTLTEVYFFIQELPESASIKIYSGSDGNAPKTQLYSGVVSNNIQANAWNTHSLNRSVDIPDDDLWISFSFSHTLDQRTLGCDIGPANPNGDWLFDNVAGSWLKLSNVSAVNINWNIRAAVLPQ